MSYSYKPVFLISLISTMNEKGEAELNDVAYAFSEYYKDRKEQGLPAEKKKCIFTEGKKGTEKILDLACGFGWHSLEFARRGYDVTGPKHISLASYGMQEKRDLHYLLLNGSRIEKR